MQTSCQPPLPQMWGWGVRRKRDAFYNLTDSEFFFFSSYIYFHGASLVVKNLPSMWKTQVQSLGWEDPLEKEMATHSSFITWRISWKEEPGG